MQLVRLTRAMKVTGYAVETSNGRHRLEFETQEDADRVKAMMDEVSELAYQSGENSAKRELGYLRDVLKDYQEQGGKVLDALISAVPD